MKIAIPFLSEFDFNAVWISYRALTDGSIRWSIQVQSVQDGGDPANYSEQITHYTIETRHHHLAEQFRQLAFANGLMLSEKMKQRHPDMIDSIQYYCTPEIEGGLR